MRAFGVLGTAMAIGLLWSAGIPATGEIFERAWSHYVAHFGVFAAFAVVWTLALRRVPAPFIGIGVVAFGFAHETLEIAGHAHAFEWIDACVNAVGAIAGVLLARGRGVGRHNPSCAASTPE